MIISIANQKGGVAKTTTAINLAAGLAMANVFQSGPIISILWQFAQFVSA